jgi:hypothetical protein
MTDRKFYVVNVVINGVQLPTFHLDADILGILSQLHAENIVYTMLGDIARLGSDGIDSVTVVTDLDPELSRKP